MRIEHDLPLPMILMGEPLANYVKSLDCRSELASEARTKTGNELLLLLLLRSHFIRKTIKFKKGTCEELLRISLIFSKARIGPCPK